jgi:hypothetical protein
LSITPLIAGLPEDACLQRNSWSRNCLVLMSAFARVHGACAMEVDLGKANPPNDAHIKCSLQAGASAYAAVSTNRCAKSSYKQPQNLQSRGRRRPRAVTLRWSGGAPALFSGRSATTPGLSRDDGSAGAGDFRPIVAPERSPTWAFQGPAPILCCCHRPLLNPHEPQVFGALSSMAAPTTGTVFA